MAAAVTTDRAEARRRRRRAALRLALRYALIYAVAAIAWIVLSDRVLAWLTLPHDLELVLSSVKGVGFVIVTAALLMVLGWRYFQETRGLAGALHAAVRERGGGTHRVQGRARPRRQGHRPRGGRHEPDAADAHGADAGAGRRQAAEPARRPRRADALVSGGGGERGRHWHARPLRALRGERGRLRAPRGVPDRARPLGARRAGHQRRPPRGAGAPAAGGEHPPGLRRRARRGHRRQADPAHRRGAGAASWACRSWSRST